MFGLFKRKRFRTKKMQSLLDEAANFPNRVNPSRGQLRIVEKTFGDGSIIYELEEFGIKWPGIWNRLSSSPYLKDMEAELDLQVAKHLKEKVILTKVVKEF